MRIAILQGAFFPIPPSLGGAVEKMWFALGKEFAKNGHEITHISRQIDGLSATEQIDGVTHRRVRGHDTPKSGLILKYFDLLYTMRVRKLFHQDFDVIISNTFWAPILLQKKARQVVMVDVQRMPKRQMRLYGQAAQLRANSSSVANAIRRELPDSWHKKVLMIPNPLPFIPSQEVDYTLKKPVILYVGRIHPEKGLDLLINAYKQTDQTYRLIIVGPFAVSAGGGGEKYFDFLKQLAGNAVDFVGPVFNPDLLNQYYMDASIFVYPSLAEKGETFGLAPLEAMAWGCVPIVSSLSCFQDFITSGQNGLVFNHRTPQATEQLAECISYLQKETELRQQLSLQAINVRQTHSTQHIANLFLSVFQNKSAKTTK